MVNEVDSKTIVVATAPTASGLVASAIMGVVKGIKGPAQSAVINTLGALQGYSKYLEETYERVATFKTFANPAEPVKVLDHFVATTLENSSGKKIDQDTLVTMSAASKTKIVISASAGFGKSMLMRYIALCLFEKPQGRIPLFIELRHLNRLSNPDLLEYIHLTYRQNSKVQRSAFDQGLSSGIFCFIFDGFDELNHEVRQIIEDQILSSTRLYPKNSYIVSSRPDERFGSWRAFKTLKVLPMGKAKVIQLINKLNHDKGTKRRFIQKIKSGLYETHESFLSTPLLAILMLLTYQENANIPDKIHLFYNKAFETLFHKHDALKEQYDRKRKSSLQIDDFSKVFSAFCLKTYVLEKTEFNRKELHALVKEAIDYCQFSVSTDDVLFDMREAVCLIQQEGPSYFFVHRSFQEYFTALFLSSCPEDIRDHFIESLSARHWDNVLSMLYEMASAQLEPSWITKNCDDYLAKVGLSDGKIHPVFAKYRNLVFIITESIREIYSLGNSDFQTFISVMRRFYPKHFPSKFVDFPKLTRDIMRLPRFEIALSKAELELIPFLEENGRLVNIDVLDDCFEALRESGFLERAISEYETIKMIRSNITIAEIEKKKFLDKVFFR